MKKKEEAILFRTTVLVNEKGEVVVDHESLPSAQVLKKLGKGYHSNLITAIVGHCKSKTYDFDDSLNVLLKDF